MNVGIVTFHNAPSYGAFLQAYALATFLQQSGHSVQVVDYMPFHRKRAFGRRFSFQHFGINRSNVRWLENLPRIGYNLRRRYVFSKAVRAYLPLTAMRYTSLEQLQQNPPQLDACIVGSDQVWNPAKSGRVYDPAYFAGFGPPEMRRIAYAASFGRQEPIDDADELPRLLGLLDRISVRERSGIPVVGVKAGKEACQVLDPTFLIGPESYPQLPASASGQYVLGYFLGHSERNQCILQRAGSALGMRVLSTPPRPESLRGLRFPGPLQLLALLRNARYVVTDSFHGLALAINHHVDFTSLGLSGANSCLNTRMVELLETVGLPHRFMGPDEPAEPKSLQFDKVDWPSVDALLRPMRDSSRRFLLDALNDTGRVGSPSRASAASAVEDRQEQGT